MGSTYITDAQRQRVVTELHIRLAHLGVSNRQAGALWNMSGGTIGDALSANPPPMTLHLARRFAREWQMDAEALLGPPDATNPYLEMDALSLREHLQTTLGITLNLQDGKLAYTSTAGEPTEAVMVALQYHKPTLVWMLEQEGKASQRELFQGPTLKEMADQLTQIATKVTTLLQMVQSQCQALEQAMPILREVKRRLDERSERR